MKPIQVVDYLNRNKITKDALAKALGVTPGCVQHWCNGFRKMPETTVRVLKWFEKNDLDIRELLK